MNKWWSEVLETARANGQLPPAAFRVQAAAAALNQVEDEVSKAGLAGWGGNLDTAPPPPAVIYQTDI